MLTLLEDIIKNLDHEPLTNQVREICETIHNEEIKTCKHLERLPSGPNIFLSIEIQDNKQSVISYLSLERESETVYIIILWKIYSKNYIDNTQNLKKCHTWEIIENQAEKILIKFAKIVKMLRGE